MTRPPRAGLAFLAAGVAASVVEVALADALVTRVWTVAPVLAAHAALVLTMALWVGVSSAARADLRLPLLLVATTAALGPFGSVGTLLTAGLSRVYARTATPFEEWYALLFPDDPAADGGPLPVTAAAGAARGSVAPFVDILAFGTVVQKQELIALIANEFQPAFAPALRLALDDTSAAVRVQAASAITRIEDDFQQRSLALAEDVRTRPGDASCLRTLATFHDEYANAGIFDAARAAESRRQASRAYLDYLELMPADHAARAAVGRLLLQDGRLDDAAAWLTPVLEDPDARPHAVPLLMDVQYRRGRLAEVRRVAAAHYAEMRARDDVLLVTLETMRLWAGDAA